MNQVSFPKHLAALVAIAFTALMPTAAAATPAATPAAKPESIAPAKFVQNLALGKAQTIVTMGTSLTEGGAWVPQLQALLNQKFPKLAKVVNLGRGASSTAVPPGRCGLDMVRAVVAAKPDTVFIEFGMNDCYLPYHITPEQSEKNLNSIIDSILRANPETEIIVQTMNSTIDCTEVHPLWTHASNRPKLAEYYQINRNIARQRGLRLIDHYPNWLQIMNSDPKRFADLVPDRIHPNAKGASEVIIPTLTKTVGLLDQGASAVTAPPTPAELADPTIDTIRPRIDFFASASLPFGMVALHPDTHHSGQLWDSGYRWNDKRIQFFTHSHMVQTPGVSTMPSVGPCKGNLGTAANSSAFSHDQEVIRPGYHKVKLLDSGITAEMTATCRVGMHRDTFPAADEANILFELTATLGDVKMLGIETEQLSATRIGGRVIQGTTGRRQKTTAIYFVAEFQKPFDKVAGWKGNQLVEFKDGKLNHSAPSGIYVTYRNLKANTQVQYKVAISYVSVEGAAKNLEAELPGWDFDAVAAAATRQWNDYLGRIKISGGSKAQQIKFYTDLMHTAIGRRVYSDVDGRYMDRGGKTAVVRQIPLVSNGKPQWNAIDMDCLWGTQWNLNILWTTVYPDYGNDVAQTLMAYYRNNGILGRGQWGGHENFTMTGDTSLPLLVALANNGQARFNLEEAYAACRKNAFPGGVRDHAGYDMTAQGGGCDWYVKLGYVPVEIEKRGAGGHRCGSGMTLEYAYQDWCLAQLAKQLGKTDDAQQFVKRSENWRNVFDPTVGWARPRHENGNWVTPFTPTSQTGHEPRGFIEASPATSTYYVPQNLPGLIEALGGKEAFVKKLDQAFEHDRPYRFICPRPWFFNYVEYSNQPGCHMAHLFNHAGAPWKSQYWVRQVKELTFGGTDPKSGYNGDEDEGQMGALGVLLATGLFSTQGGIGENPQLELTSPLFDSITLQLPSGPDFQQRKTFDIKVIRQDPAKDIYIQSVTLNGKDWKNFQFPVKSLLNGGTMDVHLGPQPNTRWGVK